MSFTPTFAEQEQLSETLARNTARLQPRELRAELIVVLSFLAVSAGLIVVAPPHGFELWPVLTTGIVLAVATRVKFETQYGLTGATQLGFVPLLFATPASLVPVVTAICLTVGALPDAIRGTLRPARLVRWVGNAWFAIGPALVFVLFDRTPQHSAPALLALALITQFAVDVSVSSVRYWLSGYGPLRVPQHEFWVYAVDAVLSAVGLLAAAGMKTSVLAPLALLPLLWLLQTFAHERSDRLQSVLELNETYRGTARVLGSVIDADDGYTGEHCRSVVDLCLEVSARLQLDVSQRRNLEFGALLHDVGKIEIPKEILNKPASLSPREWAVMRTHTIEGQRLLDTVGGFMHEVGLIVRAHHERWDGSGYPDGLAGIDIPLEARIIAACDAWNAMRTDRVYRAALSHERAIDELQRASGTQLDPLIVDTLLAVVQNEWMPLVSVLTG